VGSAVPWGSRGDAGPAVLAWALSSSLAGGGGCVASDGGCSVGAVAVLCSAGGSLARLALSTAALRNRCAALRKGCLRIALFQAILLKEKVGQPRRRGVPGFRMELAERW